MCVVHGRDPVARQHRRIEPARDVSIRRRAEPPMRRIECGNERMVFGIRARRRHVHLTSTPWSGTAP